MGWLTMRRINLFPISTEVYSPSKKPVFPFSDSLMAATRAGFCIRFSVSNPVSCDGDTPMISANFSFAVTMIPFLSSWTMPIGDRVNIGAGTVTCNYDGKRKNATVIEDDARIGSDTMLVAPVRVGRGAVTGGPSRNFLAARSPG